MHITLNYMYTVIPIEAGIQRTQSPREGFRYLQFYLKARAGSEAGILLSSLFSQGYVEGGSRKGAMQPHRRLLHGGVKWLLVLQSTAYRLSSLRGLAGWGLR